MASTESSGGQAIPPDLRRTLGAFLCYLYVVSFCLFSVCVCVCVCVFNKLHITAQSGPVILVILCHSNYLPEGINDTCVCVCVCVIIKLHMTAQSGFVILVILCYILPRRD